MSELDFTKYLSKKSKVTRPHLRECLAEFLGTLVLIVFGNAAVAQGVLTSFNVNAYLNVVVGYSFGVVFGIIVSAGVSGAHINPAVTLALAVWGKFPWRKVPGYMIAQYLGAFVSAAVVYWVYNDALHAFESEPSITTASIFATYPGSVILNNGTDIPHLTLSNGISDQVWGTMILLTIICAISDQKNAKIPPHLAPLMVGFLVLNIGMSYGFNCGFAINPARDLGPRFFTWLAGWGSIPFGATTVDGYVWWWVPIVAPHVGAILGVFAYTILIEMHHPTEEEESSVNTVHTIELSKCLGDSSVDVERVYPQPSLKTYGSRDSNEAKL